MKLAVSNLAWDPGEDDQVAALMVRNGVRGVELAPTKWREHPYGAPAPEVAALRAIWRDRGLEIVSLQSLLFGRPELQLFGDAAGRTALSDALRGAVDLASDLGAGAVVFGSPKNRARGEVPLLEALDIASDFFRALGDHAAARNVFFCLEANPAIYGCDFLTTTREVRELCERIGHPNVRINADLGGMAVAGEDPRSELIAASQLVGHVHASEPNLAELGTAANHAAARAGLEAIAYDGWVSIEMRPSSAGPNVDAIERAIGVAKRYYE